MWNWAKCVMRIKGDLSLLAVICPIIMDWGSLNGWDVIRSIAAAGAAAVKSFVFEFGFKGFSKTWRMSGVSLL